MEFGGSAVARSGWGFFKGAGAARQVAAARDLQALPPSGHLVVWEIGCWPVKLSDTQSDMSPEWIMKNLLSLATQLPLDDSPLPVKPFQTEAYRRAYGLDAEGAPTRGGEEAGRPDT